VLVKSPKNHNQKNSKVEAFIPKDGGSRYVNAEDHVLLSHRTLHDFHRVKYQVVKTQNVSIDSLVSGKKQRPIA